MCTALTYLSGDFYFGRSLDNDCSYGEQVAVVPRNFPFAFRHMPAMTSHYAMIGTATVIDNYPLFYDAVNEKGLGIAGLNFVGNAIYHPLAEGKDNVAQFELIPYLLGTCASVKEVREKLANLNLWNASFAPDLPVAQLHWLMADKTDCITVESVADGLFVYDNPVGVLTNNPPFPLQMFALNNYMALSPKPPVNHFDKNLPLVHYSRGMGALGLPGDLSSQSRFVRVAFTRLHASGCEGETQRVCQFFHILGSVFQTRGLCEMENGNLEMTMYMSCANADHGIYYYASYDNPAITAVDMYAENLDGDQMALYPHETHGKFVWQNGLGGKAH